MLRKSTQRLQKLIRKASKLTPVKVKTHKPKRANPQGQNFLTRKLTTFTQSQLQSNLATLTLKRALERKHQKINRISLPEKALVD